MRQPLQVECWSLPAESLSVVILSVACSFAGYTCLLKALAMKWVVAWSPFPTKYRAQ